MGFQVFSTSHVKRDGRDDYSYFIEKYFKLFIINRIYRPYRLLSITLVGGGI